MAAIATLPFVAAEGGVGPGDVRVAMRWSWGGDTALELPPLGRVVVDTHDTPLEIEARFTKVDIDQAGDLAGGEDPLGVFEAQARVDVAPLVRDLVVRSLVAAVLAGAVVGALLPRRRWRHVALGASAGLVAVGGLQVATWQRFDTAAFQSPRFEGALERAPAVLEAVKREVGSLSGVRDRMAHLSGQLDELLRTAADPMAPALDGGTRILHISDVHLNPLGLELARSLAERFEVAAIVDTGDLTSFGLAGEERIGALIDEMPVPYYFVPGNHDSPRNRELLAEHPNLTMLDGEVVEIGGVRVLGIGDPRSTVSGGVSYGEAVAARHEQAPEVATAVAEQKPDLLAVASLAQAEGAIDLVPLVIAGDVHERSEHVEGSTRMLTVGSTGATGLGSFTVDDGKPYEAQILHFRAGRLVALDYITLEGVSGAFTVDRARYDLASTSDG